MGDTSQGPLVLSCKLTCQVRKRGTPPSTARRGLRRKNWHPVRVKQEADLPPSLSVSITLIPRPRSPPHPPARSPRPPGGTSDPTRRSAGHGGPSRIAQGFLLFTRLAPGCQTSPQTSAPSPPVLGDSVPGALPGEPAAFAYSLLPLNVHGQSAAITAGRQAQGSGCQPEPPGSTARPSPRPPQTRPGASDAERGGPPDVAASPACPAGRAA